MTGAKSSDFKKFIGQVKKRQLIYNPNSRDYDNKHKVRLAWQKIADECDLPSLEAARSRWIYLRNKFDRHVETSGNEPCPHYKSLKFLLDHLNYSDSSTSDCSDSEDSVDSSSESNHSKANKNKEVKHFFSSLEASTSKLTPRAQKAITERCLKVVNDVKIEETENKRKKKTKLTPVANPSTSFQKHAFKYLKLYYQNVRGLNGKFVEFLHASSSRNLDLICITETWLNPSVCSTSFIDENIYTVYRSDRSILYRERGGGAMIAVRKLRSTKSIDLSAISSDFYEINCVGVTFSQKTGDLHVIVIYIPPDLVIKKYEGFIHQLVDTILTLGGKLLILGDFNAPEFSDSNNTGKSRLLDFFCQTFSLRQFNNNYNASDVLLDLIFSNVKSINVQSTYPIVKEDNHHPALYIDKF